MSVEISKGIKKSAANPLRTFIGELFHLLWSWADPKQSTEDSVDPSTWAEVPPWSTIYNALI